MGHLRPDHDQLRGPEGSTGGTALGRGIEAVARAGLANRRRAEGAGDEVRRARDRLRAFDGHRHTGDQRGGRGPTVHAVGRIPHSLGQL
eukprot:12019467-Alexandrium_andersonii.AAC.1